MTVSGAAIAAIGGITVNAQNKRHVQVHTRKVNNIIGTAPILFALYDQYQGHLYLHAYKSRRTTGKHVEILHARLSPLHLDFCAAATRTILFAGCFIRRISLIALTASVLPAPSPPPASWPNI